MMKSKIELAKLFVMKNLFLSLLIFSLAITLCSNGCKRAPFKPNYEMAGGYVIGKEVCKANPDEDYWLIDLSSNGNRPGLNYGDTITINGVFYKHMIKTLQLVPQFKIPGKKVSFHFNLSSTKVQTTSCTVANPVIYNLKEMTVIATFEVR
ncbi:MAG: hypothetical protein K2X48_08300 [Chitinophagaceae bacterium]|nr:hypothetical protein [Chitinophagaceae bacterium]